MRPNSRAGLAGLAAVAAVALLIGLARPAQALSPADCAAADAALRAGHLSVAKAAYDALAASSPSIDCVEPGDSATGYERVAAYAKMAERLVAEGDALRTQASPDVDGAKAAYTAALLFDDANEAAASALKTLAGGSAPTSIDIANALARAGFVDKAKEVYADAIKADPNPDPAPTIDPALKEAVEGSRLKQAGALLAGLAAALAQAAVILAFVLVTFLVARNLWRRRRRGRRLVIGAPADSGDTKLGDNVVSTIRKELDDMTSDRGGRRLEVATVPDDKIELPSTLAEKYPEAQLLADLLSMLGPRDETVTITILASTDRGAGISIVHAGTDGKVDASTEVWESWLDPRWQKPDDDNPASAAFRRLGIAAAAWLAYTTADAEARKILSRRTSSWRSYALARIGADWQLLGDGARARELYARALDEDPGNDAALNNLGRLDLEGSATDNDASRFDRAIVRLRAAREASALTPMDPKPDRNWFRATYNLAVAQLLRGMAMAPAPQGASVDPQRDAYRAALSETGAVLKAAEDQRARREGGDPELVPFLNLVEDGGALMLADIVARLARLEPNGPPSYTRIPSMFELRRRLGRLPSTPTPLGDWPDPNDILELYRTDSEKLPSRVRYNLACLMTTMVPEQSPAPVGAWDAALRELRGAFESGSSISWAKRDPSLARLRLGAAAPFRRVIALAPASASSASSASPNVAVLSRIGASFGDALAGAGVFEPEDLLLATIDPTGIAALASACGVSNGTVRRWRDQARVAALVVNDTAVGINVANLLADVDIVSVPALAAAVPADLVVLLGDANGSTKRLTAAPGLSTVAAWATAAIAAGSGGS